MGKGGLEGNSGRILLVRRAMFVLSHIRTGPYSVITDPEKCYGFNHRDMAFHHMINQKHHLLFENYAGSL